MYKPELSIELLITNKCNLRCTYCFEAGHYNDDDIALSCNDNKDLNFEDITDKLIGIAMSDKFNDNYSGINIIFWGGEPTMKPEVVRYIYNKMSRVLKNVSFFMYTNGIHLDKLDDIIMNDDFDLQISYDGKSVTDKYRLTAAGESSHDKVREAICKLYKKGKRFGLKSTITFTDVHLISKVHKDYLELNEELGSHFTFSPSFDTTASNINVEEVLETMSQQLSLMLKNELLMRKKQGNNYQGPIYDGFTSNMGQACSAGTTMFYISNDGYVKHCHSCDYHKGNKDFNIINIHDDNILDTFINMLNNPITKQPEKCNNCISTICKICNVESVVRSKEEKFEDKWNDINTHADLCSIYLLIAKFKAALDMVLAETN